MFGLPAKATQWDSPMQCYSRLAQKELRTSMVELTETMKNVCGLKVVYVLHWIDINNWLTNSWCRKSSKDWCFKYKTEMEMKGKLWGDKKFQKRLICHFRQPTVSWLKTSSYDIERNPSHDKLLWMKLHGSFFTICCRNIHSLNHGVMVVWEGRI